MKHLGCFVIRAPNQPSQNLWACPSMVRHSGHGQEEQLVEQEGGRDRSLGAARGHARCHRLVRGTRLQSPRRHQESGTGLVGLSLP